MTQPDLNPIIQDRPLPLFTAVPSWAWSRGNTSMVYVARNGGNVQTSSPGWRQRMRTPFRLYEIDVSHKPVTLLFALPSAEEAYKFRVKMYLTWSVHDPASIARFGVRDAQSIYWPFIDQRLRLISRRFSIEHTALAEAEINNDLKAAPFVLEQGIEVSACTVDLELDDDARTHLASHTDVRRATERAQMEHQLQMLRKGYQAAETELQQQMEHQAAAHELSLKQERMRFYQHALDHGSATELLLRLIEHPDDVREVTTLMKDRRDNFFDKVRDLLHDLAEKKLLNPADLDDMREHVVLHLQEAMDAMAPEPHRTPGTEPDQQQRQSSEAPTAA